MTNRAAEILREKLDFFEAKRAETADAAQQFQLDRQIRATKDELRALEGSQDAHFPAGPPPPPRVPPRPVRCFGRTAEVEALVAAFCGDPPSPTPLLGGPGVGKSTISLEVLQDERVRKRFGARRYFVRCETAASGAALVQELARGLGLDLQAVGNLADRVFAELERGPAALVLDNLETPWWTDREPVEELLAQLAGLPGVALAVSLRGTKRPGRVAWGTTVGVEVLPPEAARRAFLAIAGEQLAADPNLADLLTAVERIALAVELLAYQAEGQPDLAGLRRRWVDEKARLLEVGGGPGGSPASPSPWSFRSQARARPRRPAGSWRSWGCCRTGSRWKICRPCWTAATRPPIACGRWGWWPEGIPGGSSSSRRYASTPLPATPRSRPTWRGPRRITSIWRNWENKWGETEVRAQ